MQEKESSTGQNQARLEAQRMFDRMFVVFLVMVGVFAAMLLVGLLAPSGNDPGEAEKAEKTAKLVKSLLMLLFIAVTIISLGVRWTGTIIAGRRFDRKNLHPAARAVAASQTVSFLLYGLFLAAALYYRLAAGGSRGVLAVATLGAMMASFYFLKAPPYLLRAVFAPIEDAGVEDAGVEDPSDGGSAIEQ